MGVYFSRFLMAVLTGNLLIVLYAVILCHSNWLPRIGYRALFVLVCAVVIRFILVVEFPFTKNVYLPETLSKGVYWLRRTRCTWHGYKISVWSILVCIWLAGVVFQIIRYVRLWRYTWSEILRSGRNVTDTEPYCSLLRQICEESHRRDHFQVIETGRVRVPCLFGIIKPYILLPPLDLSEEEIELLLRHEVLHHFKRDLLFKQVIVALTMFYWWNPAGKILRRQTDMILDMRIDNKLAGGDAGLKAAYLQCLIKMVEHSIGESKWNRSYIVSISGNVSELENRFKVLTEGEKQRRTLSLPVILGAVLIVFVSYTFILEGYYIPETVKESTMFLTEEDDFAVRRADGTYDIYLRGRHIETVNSLEHYPHDIKIYEEGEIPNED